MRQAMLPAGGAHVTVTLLGHAMVLVGDGSARVETIYLPDLLMHFTIYDAVESEDAAKRRINSEISLLRNVWG